MPHQKQDESAAPPPQHLINAPPSTNTSNSNSNSIPSGSGGTSSSLRNPSAPSKTTTTTAAVAGGSVGYGGQHSGDQTSPMQSGNSVSSHKSNIIHNSSSSTARPQSAGLNRGPAAATTTTTSASVTAAAAAPKVAVGAAADSMENSADSKRRPSSGQAATKSKTITAASRFNAAAAKVVAMSSDQKQKLKSASMRGDRIKFEEPPEDAARRRASLAGGASAGDFGVAATADDDTFGATGSDVFASVQPLNSTASGTFQQQSNRRRSRIDSAAMSVVLEKEDTFLGSSTDGAMTLRKIFFDADVDKVDFLTPDQTFAALKVVGVAMKMDEMHEMLDEIDANGVIDDDPLHMSTQLQLLGNEEEMGDFSGRGIMPTMETDELSLSGGSISRRPLNPLRSIAGGVVVAQVREEANIEAVATALATNKMSSSAKKHERRRRRRVLFEDFEKLIELWQSAARFQLFEKRSDETEARLQATTERKFLATDSAAMWVWQLIMLFVGCYLVMVPVAVFTNTDEEMAQYFALYTPFDAIVTMLLAADMALKCCTCVTKHVNGVAVVVDDLRGIIHEYVRSPWFWIDLLVLVPWRFTVFAGGKTDYLMTYDNTTKLLISPELSGCVGCKTVDDYLFAVDAATVLLLIRALKFLEHFRYFEETGLTPLTRNFVQRQYVVGMGLIQLARFVVLVHTLAVIYLSLYRYNNATSASEAISSASTSSTNSSSSFSGKGADDPNVPSYAEAMYLVLYIMATVGYGDIPPRNTKERAYFMFLIIVGWLFNAYIIGSLVGFFSTSDIETARQSKLLELSTLLEHFEVPPSLTLEILSFEDYLLANSIKKSFGHVVNDLPPDMQRNVELWNRVKVINSIPFFQVFHKSAKLQICNVLVEITFCPEDYVYMIGELGTEMFFVNHGFVDILNHNSDLVVTKKAGDSFGEIGAFEMDSRMRSEDAKCLTYCEFFLLSRDSLTEVRQRYPRVQRHVETYCEDCKEEELAKLDLAMSVRYHVSADTDGGMNVDGEGEEGWAQSQRRRSRALSKEGLPDGQFALGFGEDDEDDGLPRRNSFASMKEGEDEDTTTSPQESSPSRRPEDSALVNPVAHPSDVPADSQAESMMLVMDDPLCGFRLTQRNSSSGINDGVAGVFLSVSVREMAASQSARGGGAQAGGIPSGKPSITVPTTNSNNNGVQLPPYYLQQNSRQQSPTTTTTTSNRSPTTTAATATGPSHNLSAFAGSAGTGDGPHKTPSGTDLVPPKRKHSPQTHQQQERELASFSSLTHLQPVAQPRKAPLSPVRNPAATMHPFDAEVSPSQTPRGDPRSASHATTHSSSSGANSRDTTPRYPPVQHHTGNLSQQLFVTATQQLLLKEQQQQQQQQQQPAQGVVTQVPTLSRTLSTGSHSGNQLQRPQQQLSIGGAVAVMSIAQRKRQQQQLASSGGSTTQQPPKSGVVVGGRPLLSVDVGDSARAPSEASSTPYQSVQEHNLSSRGDFSGGNPMMQLRLSPMASGASPGARQARADSFQRHNSGMGATPGRSLGRVATSLLGGSVTPSNTNMQPLRSPRMLPPSLLLGGGGDPTTSVEQRHLLLPPARLHLGTRAGSHSPLMPSLGGAAIGNRLTPTAANGRFTAVRFSGLNDSTLDELYPLMGGSLSGRQHVVGAGGDQSPLPLPRDIDADDWNFVRSEVGRLKHAALVEIIMHCLGGAVDVHDALNGMGQGGGDSAPEDGDDNNNNIPR